MRALTWATSFLLTGNLREELSRLYFVIELGVFPINLFHRLDIAKLRLTLVADKFWDLIRSWRLLLNLRCWWDDNWRLSWANGFEASIVSRFKILFYGHCLPTSNDLVPVDLFNESLDDGRRSLRWGSSRVPSALSQHPVVIIRAVLDSLGLLA